MNPLSKRILIAIMLPLVFCGICREEAYSLEFPWRKVFRERRTRSEINDCLKELQATREGSDKEAELQKKIIDLVHTLDAWPPISEKALEYEGRAQEALVTAHSPETFLVVARQYKSATREAPWVASNYYNLAIVLEKAGLFQEAIGALRMYLISSPHADDAAGVKKKIVDLARRDSIIEESNRQ